MRRITIRRSRIEGSAVSRRDRTRSYAQWRARVGLWRHRLVRAAACICHSTAMPADLGPRSHGFKMRESIRRARMPLSSTFFYGINFEFSYNARLWDPNAVLFGNPLHHRAPQHSVRVRSSSPIVDVRLRLWHGEVTFCCAPACAVIARNLGNDLFVGRRILAAD